MSSQIPQKQCGCIPASSSTWSCNLVQRSCGEMTDSCVGPLWAYACQGCICGARYLRGEMSPCCLIGGLGTSKGPSPSSSDGCCRPYLVGLGGVDYICTFCIFSQGDVAGSPVALVGVDSRVRRSRRAAQAICGLGTSWRGLHSPPEHQWSDRYPPGPSPSSSET